MVGSDQAGIEYCFLNRLKRCFDVLSSHVIAMAVFSVVMSHVHGLVMVFE